MAKKNKTNTIEISRLYDAPVKAVWDAWTTDAVGKWWGPRGFTITTHGKDLKPGGFWKYTMHGPDGVDYPNRTIYYEVEKYSRMVYDHGGSEDRPPLFRVTVTFKEVKGKTQMDMSMSFATVEVAEETKKFIKAAGGNSTWDRLGEFLETQATGNENFIINRSFDTPIETMYEAWTNPEHFCKWLPPTGFTMQFIKADIRPGGSAFYVMTGENGMKMYGGTNYIEFNKPNGLSYTQHFADEKGNISRHPMSPTWPAYMLTTVKFSAEGPEQTRVTITWEPHGNVTAEELETFAKAKAGMTVGWTGSFDKLEEYLDKN